MFATSVECSKCKEVFQLNEAPLVCGRCGSVLNVRYDLDSMARLDRKVFAQRVRSLWRYLEFLPVKKQEIVSLGEGFTPVVAADRIAAAVGLRRLLLKVEFLNPTGSFKDRGTTVSVSDLKRKGVTHAFDDSSGNAGSSLAAYCARAAIRCTIYAPANTLPQKLLQARIYGGKVVRVPGSRTAASRSAERAWRSGRGHYASHSRSAFFVEGTKTFALEVAENLSWEVPEHLVFSVGGGSLYLGALKGFLELHELGWIKRIPKLHCVQSEACMPVVEAFQKGWTETKPARARATIAAGIKVANPPRGVQILEAIRRTGGRGVTVTDHEILAHQKALARTEGIFAEPTSCAALAGLARLVREGSIHGDETVMVPLTGFGLKDMVSVAKA